MNTSKKMLVSAALAAIAGFVAAAPDASALSCGTNNIPWTTQGRCAAPNQNRGSLQGGGVAGTNGRNLFIQVTSGFGNTGGTGRGLNSSFNNASGPTGTCLINAAPGQSIFTPNGRCNNGFVHRLTVSFN